MEMSLVSSTADALSKVWTATDLVERFGAIPLDRIRHDPPPGLATERDLVEIHDHEDRLYELVDGVLVEKTVGAYESYLAAELVRLLGNHAVENNLGVVLGADGMMRLAAGLVRIPDVSFISHDHWSHEDVSRQPIADLVPDLAVEVISQSNTREEMEEKLRDYFDAQARLVWYVYPAAKEVRVYESPERYSVVKQDEILDGGDVLPGFSLELCRYFAKPQSNPETQDESSDE